MIMIMNPVRNILSSFILLFFSSGTLSAQLSDAETDFFRKEQDSLKKMAKELFRLRNDSLKILMNEKFNSRWEELLLNQQSFHFNFDSLRRDVGILKSADEKFRIINWDMLYKDGTHKYFGFIQVKNEKTNKYDVYELKDVSETPAIKSAETHSGDNTRWFGMLYYKIVKTDDYYILLGLDEYDKFVTKKVIDVLSFKSDGTPVFGKNVFNNVPKKHPKRMIFEYSAQSTITVDYDENDKKIIFNHVGPPDPFLEGQYQFYIPDGSFDCFQYKRGSWNYKEDCDARNPKSRLDNAKPPKDKEKPIFVPH